MTSATFLDGWNFRHWQENIDDIWVHYYDVTDPVIEGRYYVKYGFSFDYEDYAPILQFDTTLTPGSTLNSASVTRTRVNNTANQKFNYYLGTWAATPPAEDAATFNGGTLAGTEYNNTATNTVTLDTAAINTSGTTSLRINSEYVSETDSTSDYLENITLNIEYTLGSIKKFSFIKIKV